MQKGARNTHLLSPIIRISLAVAQNLLHSIYIKPIITFYNGVYIKNGLIDPPKKWHTLYPFPHIIFSGLVSTTPVSGHPLLIKMRVLCHREQYCVSMKKNPTSVQNISEAVENTGSVTIDLITLDKWYSRKPGKVCII